jgi:monoamine oxidase
MPSVHPSSRSRGTERCSAQMSSRLISLTVRALDWLGKTKRTLLSMRSVTWEQDPWIQGGYAVFGPGFDPLLRSWLARSCGRILFAGEHPSLRWQGYMQGAVESGLRAAAEVRALSR